MKNDEATQIVIKAAQKPGSQNRQSLKEAIAVIQPAAPKPAPTPSPAPDLINE